MIPRLETVEEVREAVSYLRFPPVGVRGVALLTRGAGLNETPHAGVQDRNPAFLGIFQVESPGAVENANEIAAIEGVDVLFVGPADLSHSLGIPGQFTSPRFHEALARVVRATNDHGKAAGILSAPGPTSSDTSTSASGSSGSGPTATSSSTGRRRRSMP